MKKLIFILIAITLIYTANAQTTEVEAIDKALDEAYEAKNLDAAFKNISPDCVFYGTDINERWDLQTFRSMIEKGLKQNMPVMKTISREIILISNGTAAIVIKKIKWPVFKSDIREICIYEKTPTWKIKSVSWGVTMPNSKINAFNNLFTE